MLKTVDKYGIMFSMDKQKLLDEINEHKDQMKRAESMLTASCKRFFSEISKRLFEENNDLQSFSWTQYTPYFNDGDTCEFSAHTSSPYVNGLDEYIESDGSVDDVEREEYYSYKNPANSDYTKVFTLKGKRHQELLDQVKEFLGVFDEEVLHDMFGDHAKIFVTRKGVDIVEYEHD